MTLERKPFWKRPKALSAIGVALTAIAGAVGYVVDPDLSGAIVMALIEVLADPPLD